MKYSQIKAIKTFTESLFSAPCYREVLENVENENVDFEVENVRFINAENIDEIQSKDLQSDLYCLGCFNTEFIAEQCNWPFELVKAAQDGEAFEALGKAIADNTDMIEFAQAYSRADGYGHHFNGYDFGEEEIEINGKTYYVFDQH